MSRFWTNYEAWLAMKTVRKGDLRPAKAVGRRSWRQFLTSAVETDERRWTIVCTDENRAKVEDWRREWWNSSAFVAINKLKSPKVAVTNEKDKVDQIETILKVLTSIAAAYLKRDEASTKSLPKMVLPDLFVFDHSSRAHSPFPNPRPTPTSTSQSPQPSNLHC